MKINLYNVTRDWYASSQDFEFAKSLGLQMPQYLYIRRDEHELVTSLLDKCDSVAVYRDSLILRWHDIIDCEDTRYGDIRSEIVMHYHPLTGEKIVIEYHDVTVTKDMFKFQNDYELELQYEDYILNNYNIDLNIEKLSEEDAKWYDI